MSTVSRQLTQPQQDRQANASRHYCASRHYHALLRRLLTDNDSLSPLSSAIGLTGCQRREGVTTVATNLAIAAAEIISGKVLLVDANVSHPTIGRIFQVNAERGLLDGLRGAEPVFECVMESAVPKLSLLPTARVEAGHKLAFGLGAVEETLDSLKHVFQLIVFDLPPVHPLTTCYSLAGCLDGVLLVAGENLRRDVAIQARKHLSDVKAKVIGAVYNKYRHRFGDASQL